MGKSRFILPNAFTSMNFLLGVFAICWVTGAFSSFTSSDPIRTGAYFIILSVLLDKLDGFAARLVNASSEFGAQFDSLADLIAFGLAPAFTVFFTYKTLAPEWFQANGALLIVTFSIYVLCAAMRLAKYNACDSDVYHHHFSGLPSTFAGAINAILIVYLKSNGLFENPANWSTHAVPADGDSVTVNYHGVVWGKDTPFDSSFNRHQPATFAIGVGQVIKGWDQTVTGHNVGSRLIISIPPEYGYGSRGVPQAGIGGGDTLVFVVDIISVN